ncbi:MAG: hypothetical protein QXT38_02025 [Candidatus Aenigmatarchaeota archaeon]
MGLLAQIYAWEAIISILLILASFYFFLSQSIVKESKEEFNTIIFSRDFLTTINNLNLTYLIFSNTSYFENFTTSIKVPEYYIPYFSTKNLIKNSIVVASNCTEEEINRLKEWFDTIFLNRRKIKIVFISSNLDAIPYSADVLLICGYKNLTNYENSLLSFLKKDKGIIGFFDVSLNMDQTTKKIFGINSTQSRSENVDVLINKPYSISQENYLGYKYFYGLPISVYANGTNSTTKNPIGNFTFRNYSVLFEINSTNKEVYFYTSQIIRVREREKFSLYGYNFLLAYVENSSIYISFKKVYNFTNFIDGNIIPILLDDNENKIFLYQGYYNFRKVPVAVLNGSKVAWISNFDRYRNATDDKKLVLLSLILAISDKNYNYGKMSKNLVLVPFIDVENYDFFEPYSVKFGYGLIY